MGGSRNPEEALRNFKERMVIDQFLPSLLHFLSILDFVEKVDLHTEVFVLKGKAILEKGRSLQVYFNEQTGTTAFALIENDKRLWGIDFDNVRGWHIHPIEDPESHNNTAPKSISEIVGLIAEVWTKLP